MSKDDDLIIRVRDNYKHFNIMDYYKNAGDKTKESELAIIMNKAKSVQYMATFGANNLIIRI